MSFITANNIKLFPYQEFILEKLYGGKKIIFINIIGDAWQCELKPKNINGQATLKLKDYDENNKLESEIAIQFTKGELTQFIDCLKEIRKNMD